MAKDTPAMSAATNELADLKAAHRDLADEIAKYRANDGIEPPINTAPAPPATKTRRPRRTAK